jgi:hypothetical protein
MLVQGTIPCFEHLHMNLQKVKAVLEATQHRFFVVGYFGGVAQLVRVRDCQSRGREFESRHHRHAAIV